MEDYEKFKIKSYDLWDLFLSTNQSPYLGRCYAWARRVDAKKITDMNPLEREELFEVIIPSWDEAINKLFQHDWVNIAILGNETPHLHAHQIPRYNSPRNFEGIEFVDPNPGGNYAPYLKRKLDETLLLKIKTKICETL